MELIVDRVLVQKVAQVYRSSVPFMWGGKPPIPLGGGWSLVEFQHWVSLSERDEGGRALPEPLWVTLSAPDGTLWDTWLPPHTANPGRWERPYTRGYAPGENGEGDVPTRFDASSAHGWAEAEDALRRLLEKSPVGT